MEDILLHGIAIARKAGEAILQSRKEGFETRMKDDNSPVTNADLLSDNIICEGLSRYGWPILSEEKEKEDHRNAEYVWLVDPLDGTRSFARGEDDFCVMIGLAKRGRSVLGVVYQPTTDKLYSAREGGGAFLEVRGTRIKLKVSDIQDPEKARIIFSKNHPTPAMDTLASELKVASSHRMSSSGVKMGLIAEGMVDLFFNPTSKMGEWDLCAPQIIVEEAEGRVSGVRGEELIYNKEIPKNPYGILATNGLLHAKALEIIQLHKLYEPS